MVLLPVSLASLTILFSLYRGFSAGVWTLVKACCYVALILLAVMIHKPVSNFVYETFLEHGQRLRLAVILFPAVVVEDSLRVLFVTRRNKHETYFGRCVAFACAITVLEICVQYGPFFLADFSKNAQYAISPNYNLDTAHLLIIALAAPLRFFLHVALTYTLFFLWDAGRRGLLALLIFAHYLIDVFINWAALAQMDSCTTSTFFGSLFFLGLALLFSRQSHRDLLVFF